MCRKPCYLQFGCRGYPPASGIGRKAVAGCAGSKVEHATDSRVAAQGTPSQNHLSRLPGSDFMYAASPQQQHRQPRLPGGMRRQSSLQPSEIEMDDAPQVRQCSTSPAHQAWYPTPEGMPSLCRSGQATAGGPHQSFRQVATARRFRCATAVAWCI